MKVFCWEVGDQVGRNGLLINESPLPASILQKVKKVLVTRILNTSFTANLVQFEIFLSKCECVTRLAGLVWSSINHLCLPRGQVTSPPHQAPHKSSLIFLFDFCTLCSALHMVERSWYQILPMKTTGHLAPMLAVHWLSKSFIKYTQYYVSQQKTLLLVFIDGLWISFIQLFLRNLTLIGRFVAGNRGYATEGSPCATLPGIFRKSIGALQLWQILNNLNISTILFQNMINTNKIQQKVIEHVGDKA